MSFDKFLLAAEPCDLYQADKSMIRVSFFPKGESSVAELFFFCLSTTEAWTFWKLNAQYSQIYLSPEKLRKVFTFQSCKFLNDKIDQDIDFSKLLSVKMCGITVNFIIQHVEDLINLTKGNSHLHQLLSNYTVGF